MVIKSVQEQLFSGRAYQIFVGEFRRHIDSAREVVEGDEHVDATARQRLAGYFHTIRGGAGFFCLQEIVNAAAELEKIFSDPQIAFEEEREFIKDLIMELEHLGTMLPEPREAAATTELRKV